MRLPSILQINLLLAAGIACFGGVGLVAYLSVTELADTAREETRIQRTGTSALQVLATFHDMEAQHRRYLISGGREDWVQYRELQERLAIEAYQLKVLLVDNPRQRINADLLAGDLRLRVQGLDLATARYAAEGREAAFEVLLDPGYLEAGNRVRASVREMVRAQEGVLRIRRAETDARFRHAAGFAAGAAFTALALMAWSLVVIARYRREREAVEVELRSAKERLELALEGSGLALWDADVPSGRVYLDERWMEMLGGPRGETRTSVGQLLEM
ncbi:MAG TPA: CHASE3 domain-containing protein, partial [Burkholderiales bacterium]